ncbi:rRNA maturation RNase YbeY [bacterium]|jgi:probable rRNA maturation factor|nr:rRNA maturation RNase YbeY [bacterium]
MTHMATARLRVSIATPDAPDPATRGLGPWLSKIAPASAKGDLSIALVSDRRMRALNRQFRGKDSVTDVLSFPSDERGFLGDVVIAAGVAKRQAKAAGHSVAVELKVLSLHGLLHLVGYDHESDDGRMARAEARLRKKAGLPVGLIERAKGTKDRK